MKFKRFLSTALAAVMATSVMSIGMVSSAFAADHKNGTVALNETKTEKTWDFQSFMPEGSNVKLNDGDTIWGITYNLGTDAGQGNLNAGNFLTLKTGTSALTAGNTISIPVPANSAGSINVVFQSSSNSADDKRTLSFQDGEKKELVMTAGEEGVSADFTATATSEGKLVLTAEATANGVVATAAKDVKILSIKITLTSGQFEDLVFAEDSLNPIEDGSGSDINVEQLQSNPNFIVDNVQSASGGTIKINNGGFIEFKVNAGALLTVEYKCGSTAQANEDVSIKTATLKLSKLNGSTPFEGTTPIVNDSFKAPANTTHYTLIHKLTDEGIYKLECSSTSTTTQISKIVIEYNKEAPVQTDPAEPTKAANTGAVGYIQKGDMYYVVSVVEKTAADSATTLKQTSTNGYSAVTSDKVYKELKINDTTYTPSQLMEGASDDGSYYLFASAIDASTGDESIKLVPESLTKLITTNITTTLE